MQEISEPLVCKIGRESERARYFPNHINTELMNVIDMNNIAIETYERGAGYTMQTEPEHVRQQVLRTNWD